MPYALVPKSHTSHLGSLSVFLVYTDQHALFIWILFATFHLNLLSLYCLYLFVLYCCDTMIREWRVGRLRAGR